MDLPEFAPKNLNRLQQVHFNFTFPQSKAE